MALSTIQRAVRDFLQENESAYTVGWIHDKITHRPTTSYVSRSGVDHACRRLAEDGIIIRISSDPVRYRAERSPARVTETASSPAGSGGTAPATTYLDCRLGNPMTDIKGLTRRDLFRRHAAFLLGVLERRQSAGDDRDFFVPDAGSEQLYSDMSAKGYLRRCHKKGMPDSFILTDVGKRRAARAGQEELSPSEVEVEKAPEIPRQPGNEYWTGAGSKYCPAAIPGKLGVTLLHCRAQAGHSGKHRAYTSSGNWKAEWNDGDLDEIGADTALGQHGNEYWKGAGSEYCYAASPDDTWRCLARRGHMGAHRAYDESDTDHLGNPAGDGMGWCTEWGGDDPGSQPDNGNWLQTGKRSECCLDKHNGYTCYARKGHSGSHRAYYGNSFSHEWGEGHDGEREPLLGKRCFAENDDGYHCTVRKGHDGDHMRHSEDGALIHRWHSDNRRVTSNRCGKQIKRDSDLIRRQRGYTGAFPSYNWTCHAGAGHSGKHRAYDASGYNAYSGLVKIGEGWAAEW